jgi:hypothetical protein
VYLHKYILSDHYFENSFSGPSVATQTPRFDENALNKGFGTYNPKLSIFGTYVPKQSYI